MSDFTRYSDEQLLRAIRQGDEATTQYFYEKGHQMAYKKIKAFGIEHADIIEIYQESFCIFLEKVQPESFQLTSQLSTYLIGICKNQALLFKSKSDRKSLVYPLTEDLENVKTDTTEKDTIRDTWEKIVAEEWEIMKNEKNSNCYKIIWLSLMEGKSGSTIAHLLGLKNEDVIKSEKSRCMKRLRQLVFKRLNNG